MFWDPEKKGRKSARRERWRMKRLEVELYEETLRSDLVQGVDSRRKVLEVLGDVDGPLQLIPEVGGFIKQRLDICIECGA